MTDIQKLKAEIERLQHFEAAYKEFSDKTDWVQESAHWSELGMHRADVLRKRVDQLKTDNTDLHATLHAAKGEIERLNALLAGMAELEAYATTPLRDRCAERKQLKAENEVLRKDAVRWQFIRDVWPKVKLVPNGDWFNSCFLEREIDAAMSKEASHD
jgi:CRISPR/Cas system-associated endoribonuclease Cas2